MSGQNLVDVLQFVLIVIIAGVQIMHFSYIRRLSDVLESCLSHTRPSPIPPDDIRTDCRSPWTRDIYGNSVDCADTRVRDETRPLPSRSPRTQRRLHRENDMFPGLDASRLECLPTLPLLAGIRIDAIASD